MLAPSGLADIVFLTIGLITIAVGIAIAYVAFRGYRRNDSRPMLFIAIGFVLMIAFPNLFEMALYALGSVLEFGLPTDRTYLVAISQIGQLLGLVSILYALLMQ